jgi:hypothetical protein
MVSLQPTSSNELREVEGGVSPTAVGGVLIGSLAGGSIGGPVGALVGAAVGGVIGWLMSLFD